MIIIRGLISIDYKVLNTRKRASVLLQ